MSVQSLQAPRSLSSHDLTAEADKLSGIVSALYSRTNHLLRNKHIQAAIASCNSACDKNNSPRYMWNADLTDPEDIHGKMAKLLSDLLVTVNECRLAPPEKNIARGMQQTKQVCEEVDSIIQADELSASEEVKAVLKEVSQLLEKIMFHLKEAKMALPTSRRGNA
ncbi:uncharacterized protein L203_105304 [Cryptococcus depauperatus CBS 7841]|uniref:Uncharacterized protein n=1 Tax=Cryptococcus depauperatus CBS 7841 TaxID=1295531 RepID=A0A1E3HYK5_9TREE|nr:hypothetical protein L203_05673 [Cryptococcus depauperatus CBS 7841]